MTRAAIAIIAMWLICCGSGCAPRSISETPASNLVGDVGSERLPLSIWRAASIEAARAIANGDTALARRLNIALARDIYAAQQNYGGSLDGGVGKSRPAAGTKPSSANEPPPIDPAAATLNRAAEALAELAGGGK